jgi:hypothetical protein
VHYRILTEITETGVKADEAELSILLSHLLKWRILPGKKLLEKSLNGADAVDLAII